MNELIKRAIKSWRKVRLSNIKYYYELFLEEFRRFDYLPKYFKKYAINIFKLKRIKKLLTHTNKLHLGCGDVKISGFINIDAFKTQATDFVCKVEDLPKYIKPNSIKLIYLSHILEHFCRRDSVQILKMFYDLLEPGGELRVSVPDLIKLADIAKNKNLTFENMQTVQGVLMGGQDTRYNYHKSIYWFDLLKQMLGGDWFSRNKGISKLSTFLR